MANKIDFIHLETVASCLEITERESPRERHSSTGRCRSQRSEEATHRNIRSTVPDGTECTILVVYRHSPTSSKANMDNHKLATHPCPLFQASLRRVKARAIQGVRNIRTYIGPP